MTPAIVAAHRRKLAGIEAVWEKCGRLNEGEIAFLIRMASVQIAEPKPVHADDIAWAREIRDRWLKVRPSAVCGGSDAQAINVFTEALSDLLSLTAIVSAAASAERPHPKAGGPQDEKDLAGRGPADPGPRADAPSRCASRPAQSDDGGGR